MEVKICGITDPDDALAALDFGADYLGLVFFEGSIRAVTLERARTIVRRLPASARTVGVFVDATPALVRVAVGQCRLSAVQLHGCEQPADFADFPAPVWRALSFDNGAPRPAPPDWPAERYVADSRAGDGGHTGGTGRPTDWTAAARLAARFPLMLAGGLTPENVADAIAAVRPRGVDTAGGVESAGRPGRKDHAAMRIFIERARSCSHAF